MVDWAEARAAQAGVPLALWVTVAVEASEALTQVMDVAGSTEVDARAALDAAAADARADLQGDPAPALQTRLTDYAVALREAAPRRPSQVLGDLPARPSLRVFTAWSRAALETGEAIDAWAGRRLERAPEGAIEWEAAASASGKSLLEWTVSQAARLRRSSSTAAQSRA